MVLEDTVRPPAERPCGENIRAELSRLPLSFASWEAAAVYQRGPPPPPPPPPPKISEQRVRNSIDTSFGNCR